MHPDITLLCTLVVTAQLVASNPFVPVNFQEDEEFWLKEGRSALFDILNQKQNNGVAKNIIFFVGDGMGITVSTAARIYKGQKKGKLGEEEHLSFEKFPNLALLKTYSVNKQVTDSAASATALFTGVKTTQGTIGLDATATMEHCRIPAKDPSENEIPEDAPPRRSWGTKSLSTVLEWAQASGKRTGFVTTSRVTHATPAALYAKTPSRTWECDGAIPKNFTVCKDIARQLVEDRPGINLNVIMGGGRQQLLDVVSSRERDRSCSRKDGRNLVSYWADEKWARNASFAYVQNSEELLTTDLRGVEYLLGLFSNGHMSTEQNRDASMKGQPHLSVMTSKAIQQLSQGPNGYFLMVEGARIDHALHDNSAKAALEETLAFDAAIEAALNATNPEETLIVVTADHSHVMTINGYPDRGNDILGLAGRGEVDGLPYTTLMFTTGGSYDYSCKNVTAQDEETGEAYHQTVPLRYNLTGVDTSADDFQQLSAIWNGRGGETHGGEDVAIYAYGPRAHVFKGLQDQSFVAHGISYAACMGPHQSLCSKMFTNHVPDSQNIRSGSESLRSTLVLILILQAIRNNLI